MNNPQNEKFIQQVVDNVTHQLGGISPDWNLKRRPDGEYLVFESSAPSTKIINALNSANDLLDDSHPFKDKIISGKRRTKPVSRLSLPETKLFRREVSESLTVDQNTFGAEFLQRYTQSVSNLEEVIVSNANCVIYGRRGAGKSSLLGYAMHQLKRKDSAYGWIALQTYNQRKDFHAIPSILIELINQLKALGASIFFADELSHKLTEISEADSTNEKAKEKTLKLVPKIRQLIASIASQEKPFTIFLDDLHLIDNVLQPNLLGTIYACTRGNSSYIKASGIEQLCNLWNPTEQIGLQAPHDCQILKLDYNLTMPHKSLQHIEGILDAHAKYCGLPSVKYLIEDAALDRLVLVAAAVPRDALSLFSQAISKALIKSQKTITVTAINMAASESAQTKMLEIQRDIPSEDKSLVKLLDRVKNFCISTKKKNAFLFKIDHNQPDWLTMQKLVAIRLVHTLHEGITPSRAGEGYQALMLDFGFYVGIRAARSVKIFPSDLTQLLAKDLRRLPVFSQEA
jgi:Cdc6-like AAA superfamily ATPase